MFTLRREGDYRIRLTRILKDAGPHRAELYLFVPHDLDLSGQTMPEQQFFHGSLHHRFRLVGQPSRDRASVKDPAVSLLSPYYEVTFGTWFASYQTSMERLRQQLGKPGGLAEDIDRALKLTQRFAQRLRESQLDEDKKDRYFRHLDVYFSWYAEQWFLQAMTSEGYSALAQEIRDEVLAFLTQEQDWRTSRKYQADYEGDPVKIWNRMRLYSKLIEYPVSLRPQMTELGTGTLKLVKATSTMLVMSFFTLLIFRARESAHELTLSLLLLIAFIYALRDVLRDDLIRTVTRRVRKGRPKWRVRLLKPYTSKAVGQQFIWLDYKKLAELPELIRENRGKWYISEERQVICYQSTLTLDSAAVAHDQIQENLSLDCHAMCEMINNTRDRLFSYESFPPDSEQIQTQTIDKHHYFNLLLIRRGSADGAPHAQRWRLTLSGQGVVACDAKKMHGKA
ncbi:MAG: hypothetical protein LAT61_03455 [Alcanivorax sp.]|nr:hypothetical protein [Alcanivorax sp.]